MRARYLVPVVLLAAISHHPAVEAFMFFKENIYCSPVKGRIVLDGKPIGGLVVKRRVTSDGLKNGDFQDQTTSNANGEFSFDAVRNRTLLTPGLFSANPSVGQTIKAIYQNREVIIWMYSKSDLSLGSEIKGSETHNTQTLLLECDLAKLEESPGTTAFVRCQGNGRKPNE